MISNTVLKELDRIKYNGDDGIIIQMATYDALMNAERIAFELNDMERLNKIRILLRKMRATCNRVCSKIFGWETEPPIVKGDPPIIDDGYIQIPFDEIRHLVSSDLIVVNYHDPNNDPLLKYEIVNRGLMTIKNEDLSNIPDMIYLDKPNLFSLKHENPGFKYVFDQETDDIESCDRIAYKMNDVNYNEIFDNGYGIIDYLPNNGSLLIGKTTYSEATNLPANSNIYFNIEDAVGNELIVLKRYIRLWGKDFVANNPTSKVFCSDLNNTEFGGNQSNTNIATIQNSTLEYNQKRWLTVPIRALLQMAYDDGIVSFPNEDAFLNYIQGKTLFVVTYSAAENEYVDIDSAFPIYGLQANSKYNKDFIDFVVKIESNLKSFKGIVKMSGQADTVRKTFQQLISTMFNQVTLQKINDLLGTNTMLPINKTGIVDRMPHNPYTSYKNLSAKDHGWTFDVMSDNVQDEIYSKLAERWFGIDVETIGVQDNKLVPAIRIGKIIDLVHVRTKEDSQSNLESNIATISVESKKGCDNLESLCRGPNINVCKDIDQILTTEDLFLTSDHNAVIVTGIDNTDVKILIGETEALYPIVITRVELESGFISIRNNTTVPGAANMQIRLRRFGSYNFSNTVCDVTVVLHNNINHLISFVDDNLSVSHGQIKISHVVSGVGLFSIYSVITNKTGLGVLYEPTIGGIRIIGNVQSGDTYEIKSYLVPRFCTKYDSVKSFTHTVTLTN